MLMSADVMATASLLNPAMGAFAKAFAGASPTLVSLIATSVALGMIPACLLADRLVRRYNKKSLALFAFVLYFIGALGPALAPSIEGVIALRAVLGFGAGLLAPLSIAMIAELFEGQGRASMIGYGQAVGSAALIALQILTGFLAVRQWNWAFLAYAPMVLAPLALAWFVPSAPFAPQPAALPSERKSPLPRAVFAFAALAVFEGIALKFVLIKLAIYAQEEGLATAQGMGALMALQVGMILLGSIFFGRIYARCGAWTLAGAWGAMVLALVLLVATPSLPSLAAALLLSGLTFAGAHPFFFMWVSQVVERERVTHAMAVVQIGLQAAALLASFVTAAVLALVPGLTSVRGQFMVPLAMFALLAAGAAVFAWQHRGAAQPTRLASS